MAGKFVVKKASGQYHFVLKASNGEIVATSERYKTKAGAKQGIESVKTNASGAPVVDETGKCAAAKQWPLRCRLARGAVGDGGPIVCRSMPFNRGRR